MKFSKYILIMALFCFLLFIVLITQNTYAYTKPTVVRYCFDKNMCDVVGCERTIECRDNIPGCMARCAFVEGESCPSDSLCPRFTGERCGYEPIIPMSTLTASPNSGYYPLTVQLTANLGLRDVDGSNYWFDCKGDGTWDISQSSNQYSCTYSGSGTYTAKAAIRYYTPCGNQYWKMAYPITTVTVTSPPPTCSISASPSTITRGSSSTLTWSSTNATSCTGTGPSAWSGSKGLSGSQSVSPTSTSTYGLSCTGSGGTRTCSTTVTVVPAFDFTVLVNPPSGSVTRDDSVQTTVTITKTQGTAANVSLSASSLPTGVTARFSPVSCTPNSTCTSTLTLTANSTAPAVTNDNIIITGTSGSIVNTTTYTLTVFVPTLSCALTAIPSSGQAPLNDVDLSANVSGTATGSIVYKFDCTNNGTWEHTSSATTTDPYRINNLCDYATANIYTAKAQVTRGGLTAECPVTITVTNDAPNVPVLIAPPNNVWINYDPNFQATVSDLGDQVRAQFQVIAQQHILAIM